MIVLCAAGDPRRAGVHADQGGRDLPRRSPSPRPLEAVDARSRPSRTFTTRASAVWPRRRRPAPAGIPERAMELPEARCARWRRRAPRRWARAPSSSRRSAPSARSPTTPPRPHRAPSSTSSSSRGGRRRPTRRPTPRAATAEVVHDTRRRSALPHRRVRQLAGSGSAYAVTAPVVAAVDRRDGRGRGAVATAEVVSEEERRTRTSSRAVGARWHAELKKLRAIGEVRPNACS